MRISNNFCTLFNSGNISSQNCVSYSYKNTLKCDTVSFGSKLDPLAISDELIRLVMSIPSRSLDMNGIFQLINKYPDKINEIGLILKNPNIRLGFDFKLNKPYRDVENVLGYIDQVPKFKDQILSYITIQRKEHSCTGDVTEEIPKFIELLSKNKQFEPQIMELAHNHNLDVASMQKLITEYGGNAHELDDCLNLSARNHDVNAIGHYVQTFKDTPELRNIYFTEIPTYNFIDASPHLTDENVRAQRAELKSKIELANFPKTKILSKILGETFYDNVKWEEIFSVNTADKNIDSTLNYLIECSKYFSKLSVNEFKYGKNIQWAARVNNISNAAEYRIRNGASFNKVIHNIALDYRNIDISKTLVTDVKINTRRVESGEYRIVVDDGFSLLTPFNKKVYDEYFSRLMRLLGVNRSCEYSDVGLTNMTYNKGKTIMLHPKNKTIKPTMKRVDTRYNELQPLFEKVRNGQQLKQCEINSAHRKIAEMYYLMANVLPWSRGTNGICDIFTRSVYKALNLNLSALKPGVSLDLEAFTLPMNKYINNWLTFFEK